MATHSIKQAVWLTKLVKETGHLKMRAMTIYGDSQGAPALTRNPVFHAQMEHIDLQHHFVREQVEAGAIVMKYILTSDNVANILTKLLAHPGFEKLCALLGI